MALTGPENTIKQETTAPASQGAGEISRPKTLEEAQARYGRDIGPVYHTFLFPPFAHPTTETKWREDFVARTTSALVLSAVGSERSKQARLALDDALAELQERVKVKNEE